MQYQNQCSNNQEASLGYLIFLGLLASLFFSSTFLLNYVISETGGHWLWSSIIRYVHQILILVVFILIRYSYQVLLQTLQLFFQHFFFWVLTGTLSFGIFYASMCYAADHVLPWILVATWQVIIIISPLILLIMGLRVPKRGFIFAMLIFIGIIFIHHQSFKSGVNLYEVLNGILPVLIAAIAFIIGVQFLNEARFNPVRFFIPHIQSDIMKKPLLYIFLMTLGSIPLWIILWIFVQPPAPQPNQFIATFFIALSAGVCATGIYFYVRNLTTVPLKIVAVDATIAGQVVITLLFEMLFFDRKIPNTTELIGLFLIIMGVVAYSFAQKKTNKKNTT